MESSCCIEKSICMENLINSLEAFYDIEYQSESLNNTFDFMAYFNQRSAKYTLLKTNEIYAFKNYEYIFYKELEQGLDKSFLQSLKSNLKSDIEKVIDIDSEHMCSVITFIFSSDVIPDEETIKAIKKFRFYKSFALGFKGWTNVKLAYINPSTKEIITNKLAKKDMKLFSKALGENY